MLEFGSAEVRLKLNTDDYDRSLKKISSEQACIDLCADVDGSKLNKKIQGLGLDCLDLCIDIDTGKIQKSLKDIQKDFSLKLEAELDVSTQMAERSLKAIEDKAGAITSTLELQTSTAESQLSSFKAELEGARALTQELSASFTAQIEQTINTSSLEQSLRSAAQEFRDSGKDIGESVADEVSKAKVKTKRQGPLAGIFRGVQEGIGFKIADNIDAELKSAFNFDVGKTSIISSLIRSFKASADVLGDLAATAVGDSAKAAVAPFANTSKQIASNLREALTDAIIASTREIETPKTLEAFRKTLAQSLSGDKFVDDLKQAGSELKNISKEATDLNRILFKVGGTLFKSVSPQITDFRREQLRTTAREQTIQKASELSGASKEVGSSRADRSARKAIDRAVEEGKKELILVAGGLAGVKGFSSVLTAKRVKPALNKPDQQAVLGVEVPNLDALRRSNDPNFLKKQPLAAAAPTGLKGFNPDSIDIAARALLALSKSPELQVKVVGESGGGLLAAEVQEILNSLGFGDRVSSIGVGTPVGPDPLNPAGFRNVFSGDEALGRAFDVAPVTDQTDFIDRSGFNLGQSEDLNGQVSGVRVHYITGYLPTAELQNFLNGVPEAVRSEDLNELQSALQKISADPDGINTDELTKSIQSIRRQFDVLDGDLLQKAKEVANLGDLVLASAFARQGEFGKPFKESIDILDGALRTADSNFDSIKSQLINARKSFDPDVAIFSDQVTKELETLKSDVNDNLKPKSAGLEKQLLDAYVEQIEEAIKKFQSLTVPIELPERVETTEQLTFLDDGFIQAQNRVMQAVEKSQEDLAREIQQSNPRDIRQLSLDDIPKNQNFDKAVAAAKPKRGKGVTEADQLSKARKAAGQELQILTAQLRNAREQNISTLAFEVVNSLKNLNTQIFKTEQALQELQAPSFDTPEIPQFNEAILGASELISKIRGEFDSLFMGVADLNQRIRNQRLPDLIGTSDAPSGSGIDEGLNKVTQSVSNFGGVLEKANGSIGTEFTALENKFKALKTSANPEELKENLNKASLSLFEFSKNADIADPRVLDSFAAVGAELQQFERRLESAAPEQSSETGIAASLKSVTEEANKAAIALKETSEKAKLFEAPDLGNFIEAPFKTLREEVSRTAQIFGLATEETTVFGGAAKMAREKLEQLSKIDIKSPELTTTDFQEQVDRAGMKIRNFSEGVEGLGELQIQNNIKRVNDSAIELEGAVVLLEKDLKRFASVAGQLAPLQEKLFDAVKFLADGLSSTGAILSVAGPAISNVSADILGLDDSLIPLLRAFSSELPSVVGALSGITELGVIGASSIENLQNQVNAFQLPEGQEDKLAQRLEGVFDKLIAKIDQIAITQPVDQLQKLEIPVELVEVAIEDKKRSDDTFQKPSAGGGSVDLGASPEISNPRTQEIQNKLTEFQRKEGLEIARKEAQKQREILSAEARKKIEGAIEGISKSGGPAIVDALADGFLKAAFNADKDERFRGTDIEKALDPVREALGEQNPNLLETLRKQLTSTKKKDNERGVKSLREVLKAGLAGDDLGESFKGALGEVIRSINQSLSDLGSDRSIFGDVGELVDDRFAPQFRDQLKDRLSGNQPLDIELFVTKESFEPIVKEFKTSIKDLRMEATELFEQGLVSEKSTEEIEDVIFKLEEMAKLADLAKEQFLQVSKSPLIQGTDQRSLVASASQIGQQANFSREQLIPSLKLSQGQLPSASELEGLLGRLSGDSGLVASARDTGDQFAAGIIEGIKRGIPLIDDTGDEAALRLLQSIRDTLGIASPAKRVIELMKFVVQGVQVGLGQGKGEVDKSLRDLFDINEIRSTIGKSTSEIEKIFGGLNLPDDELNDFVQRLNKIQVELSSGQIDADGLRFIRSELTDLAVVAQSKLGQIPEGVAKKIGMASAKINEFLGETRSNASNGVSATGFDNQQVRVERPPVGPGTPSSFKDFSSQINARQSQGIQEEVAQPSGRTAKAIREQLSSPQVLNAAEEAGRKVGEVAGVGINAGVTAVEIGRDAIETVAPAARSGVGGFFSGLNSQIQSLQQRFPVLQNFKEILRDVAFGVGSLIGVFSVGDLFVEGFRNSLEAAKVFESQVKSLSISLGGTAKALKELSGVEVFSGEISADILSARDSFKQLAAVTRGTSLEGEQTREIFEGLATATTALQLPTEQADRAFTAVGQVISKNRFQAEELRGQLAEALPGAIGILARSLGVSVSELDKLVTSGKLGADTLVQFSRQLKLEFGAGVQAAADSLQGAENRFKNAATLLQEQFGKAALPAATAALNAFSGALTFVGDNAEVIGSLLVATLGVSLFNLNARFGLVSKAVNFFSGLIGPGLKASFSNFRAELAATGGGVSGLGKKIKVLGAGIKSALGPIVGFVAQAVLLSAAIQGAQDAFNFFKADPLVDQLRRARDEAKLLRDELDNNPITQQQRAEQASNDAVLSLPNPGAFLENARRANATRIGRDQELFGSDFILEQTPEQSRARERVTEFGSDENLKEIRETLSEARKLRDEALKSDGIINKEAQEEILQRLQPQINFLRDLKEEDIKVFDSVGGAQFLASLETARGSVTDLSSAASNFRGLLKDIGDELKKIENSKIEADVRLQEDISSQFADGNFDSADLELNAARGLNEALEMQVTKQKELLEVERAKLQGAELLKRLNDPTQQAGALEEQKRIQEDIEKIEKDLLGSRKELAGQTIDLIKQERERRLTAIDILSLEKEIGNAKERNTRIIGAQENAFTADLDELDNIEAIEKARKRLSEFKSNGSEEEVLNAEKALTDAIATEENRRFEDRKKRRQAQIEFTKLTLDVETVEVAKALNDREITQVQADKRLSGIRLKQLQADVANTEKERARLFADFEGVPNTEGNGVIFQEQLNAVNDKLVEQTKALFEEQTNFKIAEEDRFLEEAQKSADTIIAADKAKTDALIRNIESVNAESETLIRSLDRQEKKIQSQFDLVNAQQARAGQGFEIAIGRNENAQSALGVLNQEKQVRSQIADLKKQSLNATDEEKEGIKEQSEELKGQLLTIGQQSELRRQIREATGSSLTSEQDLLKARIRLEENATRQRAEALAAELMQEKLLLQISLQRDQIAAKAATRQAQLGLVQSQFQQTEQQQGVLGIQRDISIAEGRGDTGQAALLRQQLEVANEGLRLTEQQIGISGGILRDSQLSELDLASLAKNALETLDLSQLTRAESFLANEESSRNQFNLSAIQNGGEDFIGGRGIRDARERLGRAGLDLESGSKSPSVESSESLVNTIIRSSAKSMEAQDASIKGLDNTVRAVGELVIDAINRNALKLPKERKGRRSSPPTDTGNDDLRSFGL